MRRWLVIGLVVIAVVVFIATQPAILPVLVYFAAGTAATLVGVLGGLAYFLFPLIALILLAILVWRFWRRRSEQSPPGDQ